MCLVLDNAPYHHKRNIGTLQGISNSKIIEMMIANEVKEIEHPFIGLLTHTGDYHDNMRSEIFLKLVNERLIPTYKSVYPGHEMCLVLDNAPYHHKRDIGTLQGISNSKIIEMMIADVVKEIELPFIDSRWDYYQGGNDRDMFDRGETAEISFDPIEQQERAGVIKPRMANLKELQVAYLNLPLLA